MISCVDYYSEGDTGLQAIWSNNHDGQTFQVNDFYQRLVQQSYTHLITQNGHMCKKAKVDLVKAVLHIIIYHSLKRV